MIRMLHLEDFGRKEQPEPPVSESGSPAPREEENGNLEAFEQGYRNGWDDCIANENEERRRIGADLAAGLRQLHASAADVREEMLASIAPLLEQIAAQLLPAVAAEAVAPLVVSEIQAVADSRAAIELQLLAAPGVCPTLENLVSASPDLSVSIVPEPAFADGQVSLRYGDRRRDIDLSDAVDCMAKAIRSFTAEMISRDVPASEDQKHPERGAA